MDDFDFDYIVCNGAEIVQKQKTVKLLPFTKNDVIDIYRNMQKFKMYIKATNINNEYIFESANTYIESLFLNEPCKISNQSLDEYLNEFYNIRSQVKASPIYELMNVLAISLGGQPSQLLNIIANEHNK